MSTEITLFKHTFEFHFIFTYLAVFITHANSSHGASTFIGICLYVCLSVFLHDITKAAADNITKLDIEMFHNESWKPTYFAFKRSKVKTTRHKKMPAWFVCTLMSAHFQLITTLLQDILGSCRVGTNTRKCNIM